jgi:release factor glutamine methyltransferase
MGSEGRSDLVRGAAARLIEAGVGNGPVDAERLLAHVLGVSRARLLLIDAVSRPDADRFRALVERRVAREPLQHLLGTAAFRYVELAVGPGVFVPRPETELLVDAALGELRGSQTPTVVDLCSGSGALALALATELPTVRVTAVEQSSEALIWLRRNVDTLGVAGRVTVVATDVLRPDRELLEMAGTVDVVVANPPYVPTTVSVGPEVKHDPAGAVFGGPEGLDIIPAVITLAGRLLRPHGLLVMEHDDTHGLAVPALFDADWCDVRDHADLTGRPRYVTARRR